MNCSTRSWLASSIAAARPSPAESLTAGGSFSAGLLDMLRQEVNPGEVFRREAELEQLGEDVSFPATDLGGAPVARDRSSLGIAAGPASRNGAPSATASLRAGSCRSASRLCGGRSAA